MDTKRKQLGQKRLEKAVSIGRAAAKLFNEKGYLETSMDDIAAAANQLGIQVAVSWLV
jgi:AcrR family transcriptional regulator